MRRSLALVVGITILTVAACGGELSGNESFWREGAPGIEVSADQDAEHEVNAVPELADGSEGLTSTVTRIVDGDTIDSVAGTVRIIGIDTPEMGECNYQTATGYLASMIPAGSDVQLTAVATTDDRDRYGRLLRYVETLAGIDVGAEQIAAGLAIARYDSSDGYGAHPRESAYVELEFSSPSVDCAA